MKQKLVQIALMLTLLLTPAAALPATASAACPKSDTATGQVLEGIGQTGNKCDDKQVNRSIKAVVQILGYVAGIAAIIMIIISGFKYITSNGDSGKVGNAKTTLIYALVGLVVAALAQVLVSFVLNATAKT